MRLIGAGLPRTATTTQKIALEMLGLPCYHMRELLENLDQVPFWQAAADGHAADWSSVFEGYESTVDWPAAFFYRELMEAYPDAKVLLSVRDRDGAERSMRDTVWSIYFGDSLMRHISCALPLRPAVAGLDRADDQHVLARARRVRGQLLRPPGAGRRHGARNDEVRTSVPAERLLEWKPQDGWEPPCEFVGRDVPSEPLPNVNDTQAFKDGIIGGAIGAIHSWWEQDQAARS